MGYGQTIRDFRQSAGLTQDALAARLGCSSGYIPYVESEKRLPSPEFCLALTEACGRSVEEGQRLLDAVEAARQERDQQRAQTRQSAWEALLQQRGASTTPPAAKQAEPPPVADLLPAARKTLEEALALYRRLAADQPHVYLPAVATTLNSLGNVLSDLNDWDTACQAYEEALALYHRLADEQPQVNEPQVAATLHSLGMAQRRASADPDAQAAHAALETLLADPQTRELALNLLSAMARQTRPEENKDE